MKKLLIILAAAIAMSAAAIETTIAYQGVLRDAQGNTLTVHSQLINFRLYSQASGGTPLWARAVTVNLDSTGLFNVELSDTGTPVAGATYDTLAEALKAARSGALFVGLEVADSSGEISPRQKILMTPYSSWAADVTNASGDFTVAGRATMGAVEVTGGLTVNGNTTLAGNTTFNNNVTVAGGITVRDTGSFTGYGTIPVGGIIMWSGSSVPDGWALCNGQTANGVRTPDLRNRFIVGSGGEYSLGATGGAKEVTLTEAQMPSHRHWYMGDDMLGNARDSEYGSSIWSESRVVGGYDASSTSSGDARVWKTSATGSGHAHENRPPYYALAFIMRVK